MLRDAWFQADWMQAWRLAGSLLTQPAQESNV